MTENLILASALNLECHKDMCDATATKNSLLAIELMLATIRAVTG